jgi:hypothetical protein
LRIDCYLSLTCGAEDNLKININEALVLEGFEAEVNFYRIDDEKAGSLGLRGSPSVLINREDIQPANVTGFS